MRGSGHKPSRMAFLQKFSTELTANSPDPSRTNAAFSFVVDQAGSLIFPPALISAPTPQPFNLAELNAEQARLWATLQAADAGTHRGRFLAQAFKKFIDSNPPENFAAAASYGQGLRLIQQGKLLEAAEALELVTEKYPNARAKAACRFGRWRSSNCSRFCPTRRVTRGYVYSLCHVIPASGELL